MGHPIQHNKGETSTPSVSLTRVIERAQCLSFVLDLGLSGLEYEHVWSEAIGLIFLVLRSSRRRSRFHSTERVSVGEPFTGSFEVEVEEMEVSDTDIQKENLERKNHKKYKVKNFTISLYVLNLKPVKLVKFTDKPPQLM